MGANAASLPDGVQRQLPHGFDVIATASGHLTGSPQFDYVVALARPDEQGVHDASGTAPSRPLLVFLAQPNGAFKLAGRNDKAVFALDQGGQCDPFEDGYKGLVVQGRTFTVRNGVACGQHWTYAATFRFDPRRGFVFSRSVYESWRMNTSTDPNAEAVVRDGTKVRRADPRDPVLFQDYRVR